MHHPLRQNVTTSMFGQKTKTKNRHIYTNLTQRYSWKCRRRSWTVTKKLGTVWYTVRHTFWSSDFCVTVFYSLKCLSFLTENPHKCSHEHMRVNLWAHLHTWLTVQTAHILTVKSVENNQVALPVLFLYCCLYFHNKQCYVDADYCCR